MNLTAKRVIIKSEHYQRIKKLYNQAFPKNEKLPMWLLLAMKLRKCVDFYVFLDNETFCGFSYLIHYKEMIFVLYLTTDDTLRSKGYGSGILELISKKYPKKEIVLNIENVIENCGNFEQRVKRQKFYFKNGFLDTGYTLIDRNVVFNTLSTNTDFSVDTYKKLIKKFSFGLVSVHLTKNQ